MKDRRTLEDILNTLPYGADTQDPERRALANDVRIDLAESVNGLSGEIKAERLTEQGRKSADLLFGSFIKAYAKAERWDLDDRNRACADYAKQQYEMWEGTLLKSPFAGTAFTDLVAEDTLQETHRTLQENLMRALYHYEREHAYSAYPILPDARFPYI